MISAEQYEAEIRAKFGKPGAQPPPPNQAAGLKDLNQINPNIAAGKPVPPGVVITQHMGRGEMTPQQIAALQQPPSMMVVPPAVSGGPPPPQVAIVPPQPTNRTTIGTIIENAPDGRHQQGFIPSTTNPLTRAEPVPTPPQPALETQAPEPPKPKKKVDLVQVMLDHIWELGGEKSEAAQKFYERSETTLKNWQQQPGRIPMEAIVKFLGRKPGIMENLAEQLEPHFAAGNGGTQSLPNRGKTSVVLCAPILDRPTLPFMWTCLYLAKKYELGFDFQADTVIHRSRNVLAQRFLKSGAQWSLWIDSDMAAPIANPEWYRWVTGTATVSDDHSRWDVLQRLQCHNKPIVGGVYASRRYHGQLVIQPEIRPRSHDDKILCNDLRKGLSHGLVDVDWVGFGCALIHREVFLELERRFPDLAPQSEYTPWRYFQPVADEGEDEAFCGRARQCGIPIWLDTDLICGHIGSMAFMPEHTAPISAL